MPATTRKIIRDFQPSAFTPLAWWLPDGLHVSNGRIDYWQDFSGNGRHFLGNATTTKRPTVQESSQNGYPAALFDGSDDYLTVAFANNQPCTQFFVMKFVTIGAFNTNDVITDGGVLGTALLLQDSSPLFSMTAGTAITSATRQADNVYAYFIVTFNGATSSCYVNGSLLLGPGAASAGNPGGLTIGGLQNGTRCTNIAVCEAGVISGAASATTIAQLNLYMKTKYNL